MEPTAESYRSLLQTLVTYQVTLNKAITNGDLSNLHEPQLNYWKDYFINEIPNVLTKNTNISILKTITFLERLIKALNKQDNLTINNEGIVYNNE